MSFFNTLKTLLKENANWRTVSLVICGIVYLLIGALLFTVAESKNEFVIKEILYSKEEEFKLKYNISEDDFVAIARTILEIEPHKSGIQWGFSGAIYFAITVVTTIGYGHSVPRTTIGKLICIFYAIFGIPLWLITIQAMGERINTGAKNLLKKICLKMGIKIDEVSHRALIPFGIFSCVITILIGTIAFAHFENWTYLNSAYYCVMTLSTIGFGDFVALQDGKSLQTWPQYVTFTLAYIMIGLTVIGAFLNLVVLRMMVTLPDTPDVSVNGASKRSSPDPDPEFSFSCDSRFDEMESQHRRISNISTNTKESNDRACNFWENDGSSSQRDASTYSVAHWSNAVCGQCGKKALETQEAENGEFPCLCHDTYLFAKTEIKTDVTAIEVVSEATGYPLVNVFSETTSSSSRKSTKNVPEVKVSHVEVPLSENSTKSSGDVLTPKQATCGHPNFLSPCLGHFRRDRYGSGDSGYLGGAPTSASNVSRSTNEDENYLLCHNPSASDSKTDHEPNAKSASFSGAFGSYSTFNAPPNQTFNSSKNKRLIAPLTKEKSLSTSSFVKEKQMSKSKMNPSFLPVFYQCDYKCDVDTDERFESNTMKKQRAFSNNPQQFKRQFSITSYSDPELAYNRSEGLFHPLKDVVETQQTTVFPLVKKESQDASNTTAVKDDCREGTKILKQFSHLERNDTNASIPSGGDLEDRSMFFQKIRISAPTRRNSLLHKEPYSADPQTGSLLEIPAMCLQQAEKQKTKKDSVFFNKRTRLRSYSNPVSLLSPLDLQNHPSFFDSLESSPCRDCFRLLNHILNCTHKENCLNQCAFCLAKTYMKGYFESSFPEYNKNGLSLRRSFHQKCFKSLCQSQHVNDAIQLFKQNQIECRSYCPNLQTEHKSLPHSDEKSNSSMAETFPDSSANEQSIANKNSVISRKHKHNINFFQELQV